jgi:hypothetical protein
MARHCLFSAAFGIACLPTDTRPPPGKLLVTVSADDDVVQGVKLSDGWNLSYDKFLVSVGHASAEGDSCTAYSDPHYSRVLDMLRPEAQKLSLQYALGWCDFDFELSSPREDSVLGEGVSEADKTFLRTPGDDAYTKDAAISIYVSGSASKAGVTKTFAWAYRDRVHYATCDVLELDGTDLQGFKMNENGSVSVDLLVRGRALFASDRAGGDTRFQPFADADTLLGDDNGEITLDELARVNLQDLSAANQDAGLYLDLNRWPTLRDFVYLDRFTMVVRYQGTGTCAMKVSPNDRESR